MTMKRTQLVALQNLSRAEARHGLREARWASKPNEAVSTLRAEWTGEPFAVLWQGAQWQPWR